MQNAEWAANSKTIHAWRLWVVNGRRWGMRALCGVRTAHDFGWAVDVTQPGALEAAQRFHSHLPTCDACRDLVDTEKGDAS
jgi:hypothetical protein